MFADNLKRRDLLLLLCNATLDTEMQYARLARVSEKLGCAHLPTAITPREALQPRQQLV